MYHILIPCAAYHKTDLKTKLVKSGIKSTVVGGLVSHDYLKATYLGGLAVGFETSLLKYGLTNWNKNAEIKIFQTKKALIENGVASSIRFDN